MLDELRKNMKSILSDRRYQHSLGVEQVSYDLALIHGEDVLKASIAGILHDCAKYLTDEELLQECDNNHIEITEIERKLPNMLLHAKVGAVYAKKKYKIADESIIKAIEYHTTGRPAMTKLEKIIFIADYIEPNRIMIPNIDYIREVAYENLDEALKISLKQTLEYLEGKGQLICPMTKETYDYYVNQ
jgi:predicted HD superfamily hydrolase involved in NAD metabolism